MLRNISSYDELGELPCRAPHAPLEMLCAGKGCCLYFAGGQVPAKRGGGRIGGGGCTMECSGAVSVFMFAFSGLREEHVHHPLNVHLCEQLGGILTQQSTGL